MPVQPQPDVGESLAVGGSQASRREPEVSIAEARWLGVAAWLIDLLLGYGPSYVGFWLALLAGNPDAEEFPGLVDWGSAWLAAVVGYLIVARVLLTLWRRWRLRSVGITLVNDRPREHGHDRLWSWVLACEGLVTRILGRPLEAALALGLFVLGWHALETLGPEPDARCVFVVFSTWTVALFLGPWVLGFRQIWEGHGRTLGRSLFGLQVQDRDGRPAGFLQLLLRDAVLRPLTWLGGYMACGLVLMVECWLFVPVIVLSEGKLRLLLQPFAVLWHAVAGGADGLTLHDLLAGTRVRVGSHDPPTLAPHTREGGRA
jgi:uncharacterized RDD family membrane protein YckC